MCARFVCSLSTIAPHLSGAVNLSLNEDLVRRSRELTGNLSEQVERLLAQFVHDEHVGQRDTERALASALAAWNTFGDELCAFADEHSTL